MFLLKSDSKRVYMKIYVHVRVFFNIMEIDGVLCELGADTYGTTNDINISPLTRQLYIIIINIKDWTL